MPGGAHENMRGWSPEEDELLLKLIQTSGKRWKLIAEALGNSNESLGNSNPRTPAMVRNRFLRIERGRYLTEKGMSKNRCGQCGELKRGHICRVPRAMVHTNLAVQEVRHQEARRAVGLPGGLPVPGTPSSGQPPLALGGAAPLTMAFNDAPNENGPASAMSSLGASPGPLSLERGFLGLSPLNNLGPQGPPSLRTQSSMDLLFQASLMHTTRPPESNTPTATPLATDFDSNPFKLPTVSAADLPCELQVERGEARPADVPPPPMDPAIDPAMDDAAMDDPAVDPAVDPAMEPSMEPHRVCDVVAHEVGAEPPPPAALSSASVSPTAMPQGCAEAAAAAERGAAAGGEGGLLAPLAVGVSCEL